jgi:hypothetical protein
LQIDNQWHTVLEFIVHRLVVPCSHADKSANAATQNRKREQRGLGNAPLGTPCLPLVNAIYKEGCDVDGNEIYCKYDMNFVHDDNAKLRNWLDFTKSYNIHYILRYMILFYHIILFRPDVTLASSMLHCGRCHGRRQKQKEREVHTHGMHLPDYVMR